MIRVYGGGSHVSIAPRRADDNLGHREKNGVTFIHGNYIKRVRNMQSVIQRELQLPTVN